MNLSPHAVEPVSLARVFAAMLLLLASLLALAVAPVLMPHGYSWLRHAISESAAQGLQGAWLARLGFVLFAFAVLSEAQLLRRRWGRPATWLHTLFAVCMVAVAAFSHRPWLPGVPFDLFEDTLHTVAATGMGFAFAFGVVLVFLRRVGWGMARALDLLAIVASVVLPLGMAARPDIAGLLQRTLFAIAYLWYGRELLACLRLEAGGEQEV